MKDFWKKCFATENVLLYDNLQESLTVADAFDGNIQYRKESDHRVLDVKGISFILSSHSQTENGLCRADTVNFEEYNINGGGQLSTTYFDPERDYFWHRHDVYEIIYVIEGSVKEQLHNETITIRKNELFIMNSNVEHADRFSEQALMFYLWVPKKDMQHIISECVLTESTKKFFDENNLNTQEVKYLHYIPLCTESIEGYFQQIMEERCLNRLGNKFILYGLIVRIISTLDCETIFEKKEVSSELSRNFSMFIKLERFLEKNMWNVRTKQLREEFHYSEQYFNQIMKMFTGKSMSQYCVDHKMELATELLEKSDLSINGIIRYLGYENKTYFYRVFKQKFGKTPQEFRQK